VPIAAPHRGHEIESRGTRVAGLDPVHALDAAEQTIVVAQQPAAKFETGSGEVSIVARETPLDRNPEQRLVACRRHLFVVGQAGGIAIGRTLHAERARLARHLPGEFLLAAGERFGHHHGSIVGGLGYEPEDGVLDCDGLSRPKPELGRWLRGGVVGDFERRIEPDATGLQTLEQQVERHDLGQRGRMAQAVGVDLMQRRAGLGVDHDRGGRRIVDTRLDRLLGMVTLAFGAGLGGVGCGAEQGHDGGKAQTSPTKPARGPDRHATHVSLPVLSPGRRRDRRRNPLSWTPRPR